MINVLYYEHRPRQYGFVARGLIDVLQREKDRISYHQIIPEEEYHIACGGLFSRDKQRVEEAIMVNEIGVLLAHVDPQGLLVLTEEYPTLFPDLKVGLLTVYVPQENTFPNLFEYTNLEKIVDFILS